MFKEPVPGQEIDVTRPNGKTSVCLPAEAIFLGFGNCSVEKKLAPATFETTPIRSFSGLIEIFRGRPGRDRTRLSADDGENSFLRQALAIAASDSSPYIFSLFR